jgi:hypothetical protein
MREPAGESRRLSFGLDSNTTLGRFGEEVYSHILRVIVVQTQHGFCLCVPIFTYRGQGLTKPGVNADDHAIAFGSGKRPVSLSGEKPMKFEPIEVKLAQGQALHEMSRINFAKVYTVEWNVKVRHVGMVVPESLPHLLTAWRTLLYKEPPDRVSDTRIPEPKDEGSYHSAEDYPVFTSTPDVLRTALQTKSPPILLSSELGPSTSKDLMKLPSKDLVKRPTNPVTRPNDPMELPSKDLVKRPTDPVTGRSVLGRSARLNPTTKVNIYSRQTQSEAGDSGYETSIADDEEHGLPRGVKSYENQSVRDWFVRDESEVVHRLATIHDQILPELESLESGLVSINVQVEWEVMAFLRKNFRSCPRIGPVLVLIGKVTSCEALTAEECLSRGYGLLTSRWKLSGKGIPTWLVSQFERTP